MKKVLIYIIVLAAFGWGIFFTLKKGETLSAPVSTQIKATETTHQSTTANPSISSQVWANFHETFQHPLPRLFVQMILILMAARVCGVLVTKIHEPPVIGEMIAGVLLGPSLLGWLWPEFFRFVFPDDSLGSLRLFSQIAPVF